jgi:hypothetical protein
MFGMSDGGGSLKNACVDRSSRTSLPSFLKHAQISTTSISSQEIGAMFRLNFLISHP